VFVTVKTGIEEASKRLDSGMTMHFVALRFSD